MTNHDTNLVQAHPEFTIMGEALSLMAQSELHHDRGLEDVCHLILPAMHLGQMRIWRRGQAPIGLALWAYLDEEREIAVLRREHVLTPDEWNCGDRPVVVDVVAPFGDGFHISRDLVRHVFPGIAFTAARRSSDGQLRKIVQFPGRNAQGEWTRSRAFAV